MEWPEHCEGLQKDQRFSGVSQVPALAPSVQETFVNAAVLIHPTKH